jgi:ribosomal protein S18 acetylase RimI-like enzyme
MMTLGNQDKKLSIVRATIKDVKDILKIKHETWLDTYPNAELGITVEDIQDRLDKSEAVRSGEEIWAEAINSEDGVSRVTYVAKLDNQIVGFVVPCIINNKNFIRTINVEPSMQGQGIGSLLMQKALNWFAKDKDIYLNVASYNDKAINFYKKFGFKLTGNNIEAENSLNNLPESEMILKVTQDE